MAEGVPKERIVVVTEVSRREGIGFAIAQWLLRHDARVLIHSFAPHDAEQAWGADPGGMDAVIGELGGIGDRLEHIEADLGDPDASRRVIEFAMSAFGAVDALVVNHAHSSSQSLEAATVEGLDRAWAVNARAAVLLIQAFAASHDDARSNGRVVLFTSGQHLAPMSEELPYAISKGAVHQMTRSPPMLLQAVRSLSMRSTRGPSTRAGLPPSCASACASPFPAAVGGTPRTSLRSSVGSFPRTAPG